MLVKVATDINCGLSKIVVEIRREYVVISHRYMYTANQLSMPFDISISSVIQLTTAMVTAMVNMTENTGINY